MAEAATLAGFPATLRAALRIDGPLLRHASFLFMATLFGQALAFVVQVVLARSLGIQSYGLYAYSFTWLSLLTLLAVMGGDRLLVRHLGAYAASAQHGLFRALLAWSLGAGAAAGLLLGLAFWAARSAFGGAVSAEAGWALRWSALTAPLMVTAVLLESALRGVGAHAAATWPGRILRPALFTLLVVVLGRAGLLKDASWALALNAASILAGVALSFHLLRRHIPARVAHAPAVPARSWLATAAFLGLNTLALHLNGQIDMLVLGFFKDEAALGSYGAVVRIAVTISLASTAVIAIIQPMIARAFAEGRELTPLVRGGSRLIFLTSAGAGAVILLFAQDLLALFGERFAAGATPLRILALGQIVNGLVSLAGPLLTMTGHERRSTRIMAWGALLNLVLNLLLVPSFGLTGAAAATALSGVAWNLWLFAEARARLGTLALPIARAEG